MTSVNPGNIHSEACESSRKMPKEMTLTPFLQIDTSPPVSDLYSNVSLDGPFTTVTWAPSHHSTQVSHRRRLQREVKSA